MVRDDDDDEDDGWFMTPLGVISPLGSLGAIAVCRPS